MRTVRIGITSMAVGSLLATVFMRVAGVPAPWIVPFMLAMAAVMTWIPWQSAEPKK